MVPVNRLAAIAQLIPRERHDPGAAEAGWEYAPMRGTPYVMRRRLLCSPLGLPCTPPPFGTLLAVSLSSGTARGDHVVAFALPAPAPD